MAAAPSSRLRAGRERAHARGLRSRTLRVHGVACADPGLGAVGLWPFQPRPLGHSYPGGSRSQKRAPVDAAHHQVDRAIVCEVSLRQPGTRAAGLAETTIRMAE